MNSCRKLYNHSIPWLSCCIRTSRLHNGRLPAISHLNISTTRCIVYNPCIENLLRNFGTCQLKAAQSSSAYTKRTEAENQEPNPFHQNALKFLKSKWRIKDSLDKRLEDHEYFGQIFCKLQQLGITRKNFKQHAQAFLLSPEELDCYMNKLEELKASGYSSSTFTCLFHPFRINYILPNLEKTFKTIATLRKKYGMSTEWIQDFGSDDVETLLEKVEILDSVGLTNQLNYYDEYLLQFSKPVLREVCKDLQKDRAREYKFSDLRNLLRENNYGIENIDLLSKYTRVPVSEIRRLTKHFNQRFVPINSRNLKENVDVMKLYGLTGHEICQVCSYLEKNPTSLLKILQKYSECATPWSLMQFLLNPCVLRQMDHKLVDVMENHLTTFQFKFQFKETFCQQTFISLLVMNPRTFVSMLEKIEILSRVFSLEEIITPKVIDFIKNLTKEDVMRGIKRTETLSKVSMDHLTKSHFYQGFNKTNAAKCRDASRFLQLPYVDVRRANKMFGDCKILGANELLEADIQTNIQLLQDYGFRIRDIRKLYILAYANTDNLHHQLGVLSSRPEMKTRNVHTDSFTILNYVQYFLEHDSPKFDSLDNSYQGNIHGDDLDDDFDDDFDDENEDESTFSRADF